MEIIHQAVECIRSGGVVLYPADTIYGLGCDPFQSAALERIFRLKGRSAARGVLLLISTLEWVNRLASEPGDRAIDFCRAVWPGPVTVLLRAADHLPEQVCGSEGKVGLRVPDSEFLAAWLEELNGPLVSTSANRSGREPTTRVSELREQFEGRVDLFIDGGDLAAGLPSTVVDFSGCAPVIVREGAGLAQVRKMLKNRSQESGDRRQ